MKYLIHTFILTLILSNPSFAVEVSKSKWINAMTTALPTAFCNSKQYFRQCFDVTAQKCEQTAISTTRICLNKNKNEIPNVLVQPKDGEQWGRVIGSCAAEAYEIALIKNRINNTKCNNPKYWQ